MLFNIACFFSVEKVLAKTDFFKKKGLRDVKAVKFKNFVDIVNGDVTWFKLPICGLGSPIDK